MYGYHVFWAGKNIHCTGNVFNKHLASLNDHCLKMVSRGRWKGTVLKNTQKNAILNYFHPKNTTSEAKKIARSMLNNVLNDSVTVPILPDFVNEIVNSLFVSAQKPTTHSDSRVNKSTSEKMDSCVSVADCKQYQRTNNSQL